MKRWAGLVLVCLAACRGAIDDTGASGTAGVGNSVPNASPGNLPGTAAASGTTPAMNAPSGVPGAASGGCSNVKLGPRRLWRLTPAQYDNTLQDLLGVTSSYGAGFPADEVIQGFDNGSDALLVTPLLADKLQAAAEDLAGKVELAKLASCASAQRDDACLRQLISQFAERAFRRPLETADVDRYFKLAKLAPDFDSGARLVVSTLLQSPHFVYRFELGKPANAGQYALGDYEVASELSYLLWQSMPDDTLLSAARSQALHTKAQVAQQVERMLKAQRAKPVVRAFVFEWLGLGAIRTVPKDTARFPELTNEVREAMIAEAERFVDHVMFEQDGSVAALLTSPTTFLDAKLASFYAVQLPAASADLQPVELAAQERRGILTLGGTMLAHSRSNDSSPVHRGKLIRERLLCQTLPPPPPGIVVQPPALDPKKTTRERYAAHSSVEPCATCHRLMDPIGLAFEHFDGIGRYRPTDNGLAIDVSGEIISSPHSDAKFVGTDQLIDKLETSSDTRDCYALQWFRYAYGFNEDTAHCLEDRVQSAVAASDGSLAAIVGILTQDDSFLVRETASTPAPTPTQAAPPPASTTPNKPDAGSSSPDAGSGTDPSMSGDAAAPDADIALPPDLDMTATVSNDFGSGYCRTYQLRNRGKAAITWSIPLDVDGTLNQHWECKISGDTGRVTFSGEDYNKTLQPGGMAEFGFCALR